MPIGMDDATTTATKGATARKGNKMGKGSNPRPFAIDREQFANNFDAIFGKKKQCEHLATIARPEDDVAILECLSCGEKVTWLRGYPADDDSADRSAAKSSAQDKQHQSAPLPSSQSQ